MREMINISGERIPRTDITNNAMTEFRTERVTSALAARTRRSPAVRGSTVSKEVPQKRHLRAMDLIFWPHIGQALVSPQPVVGAGAVVFVAAGTDAQP